jgi:hypothetical protein
MEEFESREPGLVALDRSKEAAMLSILTNTSDRSYPYSITILTSSKQFTLCISITAEDSFCISNNA